MILITVAAGLFRLNGIATPERLVFDEGYYAADGCWYAYQSQSVCIIRGETSRVHPPLGKWLIAAGIRVFGYTPLGWRIPAWLTGTLSIALLYLLARRLLLSTPGAVMASSLLAVDFLHFVHSRIAMLDIFAATFGLAAFLCAVYDRHSTAAGFWRPWRFAAGVTAGAAIASKWPGVYMLAGVVALILRWDVRDPPRRDQGRLMSLLAIAVPLLVVPALVYALSHVGRIQGAVLAWPWERGSWWRAFAGRQLYLFTFHTGHFGPYPWQSPAWSWLLLRRPVVYFFEQSGQQLREILGVGNPLVWWLSIPALVAAAAGWIRRQGEAETVILVGFGVTYLPWLLFDRVRTFVFLYYLVPVIPFLCLAIARVGVAALARPWGRVALAGFAAGTLALMVFFYPVLTARPLTYEAWMARVGLFANCGLPGITGGRTVEGTRVLPAPRPGPPPPGWCWI